MKYYIELKKCPASCGSCQFFSRKNIIGGSYNSICFICMGDEKVKELRTEYPYDKKPKECPIKEGNKE